MTYEKVWTYEENELNKNPCEHIGGTRRKETERKITENGSINQ